MPSSGGCIDKLADELVAEYANNKLQAKAAERRGEDEHAEAVAEAAGAAPSCATQLHCSRSTAGANAAGDGIV